MRVEALESDMDQEIVRDKRESKDSLEPEHLKKATMKSMKRIHDDGDGSNDGYVDDAARMIDMMAMIMVMRTPVAMVLPAVDNDGRRR